MYVRFYQRESLTDVAKRAFTRWGKILTLQKLNAEDVSRFTWKCQNEPKGLEWHSQYTARRNSTGRWDLVDTKRNKNTGARVHSMAIKNGSLRSVVKFIYVRQQPISEPNLLTPPSDLRRVAKMINYRPGFFRW